MTHIFAVLLMAFCIVSQSFAQQQVNWGVITSLNSSVVTQGNHTPPSLSIDIHHELPNDISLGMGYTGIYINRMGESSFRRYHREYQLINLIGSIPISWKYQVGSSGEFVHDMGVRIGPFLSYRWKNQWYMTVTYSSDDFDVSEVHKENYLNESTSHRVYTHAVEGGNAYVFTNIYEEWKPGIFSSIFYQVEYGRVLLNFEGRLHWLDSDDMIWHGGIGLGVQW